MAANAIEIMMRGAFEAGAERALAQTDRADDVPLTTGFEVEYSVVKAGTCELVEQSVRDLIVSREPELLTQELGAWQIELRTQPVDLVAGGFRGLEAHLSSCESRAVKAALSCGAELIRIGSFPLCHLDQIRRTQIDRYQRVPEWHDTRHSAAMPSFVGRNQRTRRAGADVISLMNSTQANLAMANHDEGVKCLNLSLSLSPIVLAVSGNARFLDGVDTGYADVRMRVWEFTHDTRTPVERVAGVPIRVGLPDRYFRSIDDYLHFVNSLPLVLKNPSAAFETGIGLNWLDARLKFKSGILLLEFRPISAQPCVAHDMAVFSFYLGLLQYYRARDVDLPDIDLIKNNRMVAMHRGLAADFWIRDDSGRKRSVQASTLVGESLDKAATGLIETGLDDGVGYLGILYERLKTRSVPADDFERSVRQATSGECGVSVNAGLESAVRSCVVKAVAP
jgi:gamma-glutamyl:cysteine ligase YbdK (ATP-grasp superfamily)